MFTWRLTTCSQVRTNIGNGSKTCTPSLKRGRAWAWSNELSAPAILNAIYHATGRRVRDLPANLERVLLGKDLAKGGSPKACRLGLKYGLTLVDGVGLCFGTFLLVPGASQVPGTFLFLLAIWP